MPSFHCAMCGLCCRNIQNADETTIRDEFLEDIPGYFAIPANQVGLSLYGWEKKKLEEKAAELNKTVTIVPLRVVIDQKRKLNIVISWSLEEDPCPFVKKDNLCPIHKDRPLVCRYFPVLPTGFSELCPNILEDMDFDKDMPSREKMEKAYGGQYLAVMATMKTHIQITSMLIELREANMIRPRTINDPTPELVQKLMEPNYTMDVLDFFVKYGGLTQEGVDSFAALYSDPERLAREGHI